ncbi:non-ribosomal peptide synthetase [Streptomyces violens]|uniref:non-ribosomal peptide synthetase n=1 Tax=Streptomyces violens TaxID=66377 RepID=UPI00146FD66C|nr:non-ribosomal peptide synthetase [Streptomyces violens]
MASTADVLALVARQLGRPAEQLDGDRTFVASGADSLSLMALAREVQKEFGVRVSVRELFSGTDTPHKLAGVLAERGAVSATAPEVAPEPAAGPAVESAAGPTVEPAEESAVESAGESAVAVVNAQLRLADRMFTKFSELAAEQLRVLGGLRPADAPPAVRPADAPPAVRPADAPSAVRTPAPEATRLPSPAPAPAPSPRPAATPAPTDRPDFSLYFFGDYPDQNAAVSYEHLLKAARFGDERGFHTLWIPERHFHSFGALFPNPSVLAASLATVTSRIRLHAGSVVLPLHHPVRVAEEWSVVDNLSGGRAGLSFASGWNSRDFALAPENYGRQRDVMYEGLETVRELWAGRTVPAMSGTGEAVEIALHPAPVQESPPMFAAVLSNPDSYARAARAGLGIVTNLMSQSVEDLRENIALYRRTRAAHGLDPDAGRVVVLVHTYLGADAERARQEARRPFCDYLRSSLGLFDSLANSLGIDVDLAATDPEDLDFVLDRAYDRYCASRALIGSRDSVRPVLDALTAAGADEIGCFIDFGVRPDLMLDALPELDGLREEYTRPAPQSAPRPEDNHAPRPEDRHPPRTDDRRAPAPRRAPATPLQRRMWLLDRMHPGRHTYHEPKALLLEGPLDTDALRVALRRTVDRHPQLRTVFRENAEGVLEQTVLDSVAVDCPVVPLTGLDDDTALLRLRDDADAEDFDLARGPLLRARLGRLADDCHLLYLVAHHIVFDAASTEVLCQDLAAFYRAWPGEPTDLAEVGTAAVPPADEDAPSDGHLTEGLEFWRRELSGAAPLELPTDRPRTAAPAAGASLAHTLDATLSERVRALGKEQGCTLFMTLLGAVGATLGRFAGQDDVVLGTAVSNRPSDAAHTVGMFVETLALRLDLSGDPAFGDLVRRVGARTAEAMQYRDIPFDQVVEAVNPERAAGRNPLFQVMVEFEAHSTPDFGGTGLTAELLDVPRNETPVDLTLYFADRPDGIRCTAEYDTEMFDGTTVRRIVEYVAELLRHAVDSPGLPLSRLPALTESDRRVLDRLQGERVDAGPTDPATLHGLVEARAAETPDAVALVGDGEPVGYGALDAAANRLAHALAARGLDRGDTAAVCLPRGTALITAILAILKCGAAYVPVDRSLPAERRRFMLTDSGAALVVADREVDGGDAESFPCPVQWIDDLDDALPDTPLGRTVDPEDAAYLIYTSGSTGRPKAVAVPHRGPVNLIRWQLRRLGALRTVQWTSPGFDVSVQEIFSTLGSGATLVLLDDATRHDPAAVADRLREYEVQRMSVPFTPLKSLAGELARVPSLRQLLIGGEKLTLTPELRALAAACPGLTLYNQYGPTETSVVVTSHRVDPAAGPVPPIGRPVDNVTVRIVDGHDRPVPVGVVGELLIGGVQVAHGYVGDPESTERGFGTAAPDSGAAERYYRTGDLVRLRSDGVLEYHGRRDTQVKIRGHRVEPEEAQWALSGLPGVREAAVLARPDAAGETALAAYVVPDGPSAGHGVEAAPGDDWSTPLRRRLGAVLPHYLVPQLWLRLDRMPYGPNGKLDRARLLAMGTATPADGQDAEGGPGEPADLQERVAKLWAVELGGGTVPPDRSFFDAGGNSLSAVRLLERVRAELGVKIPVAEFFAAPTVRAMADRLASARKEP